MATDKDTNNELPAVSNFREYLRFKSVHPTPDYEGCVKFLRRMAHELDLPYEVYEFVKGNPIFLLTWEGTDPGLSSIILNSHTDVVPVSADKWKYDPFGAVKETNGAIYGRGTQDMKSVGIQYIEAIRRLKEEGKRYPRTIHLTFMPDEELGGHKGIKPFVKSEEFKRLNAGFALDEGIASPNDTFLVFNAQKIARGIRVSCKGDPGHASQLIQNNAAEKMYKVVKGMREIREEEIERLAANPTLQLSDVITCNLTQVHGGVQNNVIPSEYELGFDIRCPPSVNLDEFEKRLSDIIESAGEGVTFNFLSHRLHQVVTATDSSNPFWVAFSAACDDMKVGIEKRVFHASTDSRFLRELGLPVLGFSPMNNTPVLLHDHDEYLDEAVFLRGIDVYCGIIAAVASVP